jgi:DNA-directed RNA polymerase subunit N
MFPVRCMSCGKPIGQFWEKFDELTKHRSQKIKETLDSFGLKRYCCRQHFLGYVNLVDESAKLKKN